jgi:hypothetical protein
MVLVSPYLVVIAGIAAPFPGVSEEIRATIVRYT